MKKLFAVLLALTLVLSMGTIAFAADDTTPTGTITISNAFKGVTYHIYKILDFAPVKDSTTQGRYTVVEEWKDFLAGDGAAYLKTNDVTGTIEWNGENTDERKAELAKAAVAYAKKKGIDATASNTAAADGDVTFATVPLGYYAIDTSLGTICALTNVDNTFNAHEKNAKPDIDKFVQEDSKIGNEKDGWGKVNDADIDQVVNYKSTITVGVGATNYVMHDTMEAGLTFNNDVVVKLADGTPVDATNYTVTVSTKESSIKDGCTFEVAFNNDFIAGLDKGDTFTVYYSATLNENAKIVVDGNDNTVYLSYGEDSTWETAKHTTTTYTWKMDVEKFTQDGENRIHLDNAVFMLLRKEGDKDSAIKFTDVTKEGEIPTYMVDAAGTITKIVTKDGGKFEIVGLDADTYYLHEEEAPAGYNKLAKDVKVVITSTYDEAALTATATVSGVNAEGFIEVENKTGSLLPETGGIGTTIFYIVGITLMLGAAIVLISKKRMASFA